MSAPDRRAAARSIAAAAVLALLALLAAPRSARADKPAVLGLTVGPDAVVAAVAAGEHHDRRDDFTLVVDPDTGREVRTPARSVRPYGGGAGETTDVVIAVQTTRGFLGDCAGPGSTAAIDHVQAALAALAAPVEDGAQAQVRFALIGFADHLVETSPLAAAAELPVTALDADAACARDGIDVGGAVNRAAALLRASPGRRILVMIGDQALRPDDDDRKVVADHHIDAYTLVRGAVRPGPRLGQVFHGDLAELASKATQIAAVIASAYVVEFAAAGLPRDGREHRLAVAVSGADELARHPAAVRLPRPSSSSRWPWILLGVVVGVILVGVLWRSVRAPTRPEGLPLGPGDSGAGAVVAPAPAALDASGPRKTRALAPRTTVALSPWTGPPGVAGWLVSLSGSSPYTTSVVNRAGETTLGADPGCGIVLTDAWVGAVHCKIVGRSGYFTIVDLASKNGVHVDGQRIDGDCTLRSGMTIVLGKTELVWKAIEPQAAEAG